MTDRSQKRQTTDKEVQHSRMQAEAMALRGVGERTLHRSEDRLSDAQAVLFARMRDEGAKVCVTGDLETQPPGDPAPLGAFRNARLARGREVSRAPDFQKMPHMARMTALRSIVGGHIEWVASHPDKAHHYYGLSARGLDALARHQTARRRAPARPAKTTE